MRTAAVWLLGVALASTAHAQHFAAPMPAGEERGALGLLEDAQPPRSSALILSVAQTRWWSLPDLQTRAVALGWGVRSLRLAAGWSQTGAPEIGFTTLSIAAGVASPFAGAGLRAASWLDRERVAWSIARATARDASYELGAGAWLVPVEGIRVWASAPQLTTRGAPPLVRTLELGARMGGDAAVWCALRAPRTGDDGERALGGSLALAPLAVWVELRDAPLRSAAGLELGWRGAQLAIRLDSHPVLGETVRTGVTWAIGGGLR